MTDIRLFRPSNVPQGTSFSGSTFEEPKDTSTAEREVASKETREAVSAYFVTFLAKRGNDDWNAEIEHPAFELWLVGNAPVHPLHRATVMMQWNGIAKAIRVLIADGYLDVPDKDGTKYYRLTAKYVAFFEPYAA